MAKEPTWKEIAKGFKKKDLTYQSVSVIGLIVAMRCMYKAGAAKMLSLVAEYESEANHED